MSHGLEDVLAAQPQSNMPGPWDPCMQVPTCGMGMRSNATLKQGQEASPGASPCPGLGNVPCGQ